MQNTLRLPMAAAAALIAAGGGLGGGFYPDDTGWRRPQRPARKKSNPNAGKQAAAKRARKITRRKS
jgi:hypothetical protein